MPTAAQEDFLLESRVYETPKTGFSSSQRTAVLSRLVRAGVMWTETGIPQETTAAI